MPPCWSVVDDVRIVDPLSYLMRGNRRVICRGDEKSADIEVKRRIRLEGEGSRGIDGMIAARAAVVEIGGIANRHSGVVNHEHRESAWINTWQSCQFIHHHSIQEVDVDQALWT